MTLRTAYDEPTATRADAATLPKVADLYDRSARASRDRWRADSTGTAPAATPRHDDSANAPRLDSIPKVADLYERHRAAMANAWRNGGDKPGTMPR